MTRRPAWALLAALLLQGCALWPFGGGGTGPVPDPSYGVSLADGPAIVAFHSRASTFYARLAHRRFNVIGTFRDESLREFFRTERAFSDYYADFAQDLENAWVERNRPQVLDLMEFTLEGPGEATVRIRIVGEDGRPLRPGVVSLVREDRWERVGGTWWIVPGKL